MKASLSEAEREAVESAVAEAERESGAEIVPVLVPASDSYEVASWKGAALGALVGSLAYLIAPAVEGAGADPGWLGAAAVLGGALIGSLLARWPRLRRALAGDAELDQRVELAAAEQFLARALFRTRERTGILIFVSLFERRVRILADEGVYLAVERPIWVALADEIAREMAQAPAGRALLSAVKRAALLVREHGPRRRSDDANELPDGLGIEG